MVRHIARWGTLLLVLTPALAAGVNERPTGAPTYHLVVEEGLVSLRANDAELSKILEDMGKRLGFEVVAHGVDHRVKDEFTRLDPRDAVARMCGETGYVEVADPESGAIRRLVLTPTKSAVANRLVGRRDPLPSRPTRPVEIEPEPAPIIEQAEPAANNEADPGRD